MYIRDSLYHDNYNIGGAAAATRRISLIRFEQRRADVMGSRGSSRPNIAIEAAISMKIV